MSRKKEVLTTVLLLYFLCAISINAEELKPAPDKTEAEEITLVSINGNTFKLSEYRGSVVLVSFWATWCPECIWEMPSLQVLSNTFPRDRFTILAVNVGDKRKAVQAFVDQHAIKFPILLDQELEIYKKWPVLGVPTSFLIDQKGRIVYKVIGAIDWSQPEILSKIRALFMQVDI